MKLLSRAILSATLPLLAAAQQATVTVTDTLRSFDGSLFSGSVAITLRYSGPLSTTTTTVTSGYKKVSVTGGAFSVQLTPNDSLSPAGTSYSVRFSASNGVAWEEIWVVPSSPATTTVRAVRASSAPAPTVMISPVQISQGGATTGQLLRWNGTAWAPTTISIPVSSVFGRTGAVVAASGDYTASQVTNVAAGNVSAITVQAAINELDTEKATAVHTHAASDVTSGTMATARLGAGTASASSFLRGDSSWAAVGWTDVTGKPSTFTPSTHSHPLSEISQSAATTGQVPKWNGTAWAPAADDTGASAVSSVFGRTGAVVAASGDYTASQVTNTAAGNIAATTVQAAINELDTEKAAAAHNHAVGDLTQSAATTGQVIKWNGTAWAPGTDLTASSTANYSQSFTSVTSVAITHNAATSNVVVSCYNASEQEIVPQSVVVTNTNTVTVTFGSATTGRCVVNSSGGGGGGSGTVTSVGLSMPSGFSVTGSPVTTSGTLAVTTSLSGVVKASAGAFSTVTGVATDCVKVDGTSGACGGSATVVTGTGLTGDGSSGNPVRVDPAGAVASQAYYTAGLDFASVAAGSCSELNITATGVAAGASVAPGWPTLPTGLIGMMYGGSGVVVVRLCNVTAAAIDPASLTFSARVIGGF